MRICSRIMRTAVASLSEGPLRAAYTQLVAIEETCRTGEHYPERSLASWFIQLTIAGEAEASCDGIGLRHQPGSMLVLAPGAKLEERVLKGWHLRYITCNGSWPAQLEPLLRGRRAHLFSEPPRAARVALLGACDELHARRPGWAWRLTRELAVLHAALLSTIAEEQDGNLADRIAGLIDADPSRSWDVASLARKLGVAGRTLQARISRSHPEGVARLVLRRRLGHARLLLERGMLVSEVSERLGFANPHHFSRACRRMLGVPPSQLLTMR